MQMRQDSINIACIEVLVKLAKYCLRIHETSCF
jgi:hypothetical protein